MTDPKGVATVASAVGDRAASSPTRLAIVLGLAFTTALTSLVGWAGPTAATSADSERDRVLQLHGLFHGPVPASVATALSAPPVDVPPPPEPIEAIQLRPRPRPGPFSMNLYSEGDFVHQQTVYWCVAASVQTMMNIIDDGKARRSKAHQKRLHFQGRRLDQDEDGFWRGLAGAERWRKGLHGLGLSDWAGMLDANGYGPYEVERARTRRQAIRMAAKAIRMTGRPAGLVVWRGAHAWVMSGFKATADPAYTNDFRVKEVFIEDPWYPDVSSIWGPSRPPNSAVPVAALAEDYLRYNRPRRRHPMRDGKFMLILPTLPAAIASPSSRPSESGKGGADEQASVDAGLRASGLAGRPSD